MSYKINYPSMFTGIDDVESECGLDTGLEWDYVIVNNGNSSEEFNSTMEDICLHIDFQLYNNAD